MATREHIALGDLLDQLELQAWALNKISSGGSNFWTAVDEAKQAWEEAELEDLKVWVATISHDHGVNFYAAYSEEELNDKIYRYVEAWWDKEMEEVKMPKSQDDAIDTYFQKMHNMGSRAEFLSVEEVGVS